MCACCHYTGWHRNTRPLTAVSRNVINVSQGSVVMHTRCGGIVNEGCVTNLLMSVRIA